MHPKGALNAPAQPRAEQLLLICGIGAGLVYVGTDLLAGQAYPGYSFANQAVSELFAIGAPTSRMVVPLFSLSSVLLLAFAAGVARSGQSRSHRFMAVMFAGSAIVGLILWNFFPMHMRGGERSFTDTIHLVLASNPFVLVTLVIGISAFPNWFRWVSVAALVAVAGPAIFAFQFAPALAAGHPTPGLGLTERGAQYAYQAWQIALALLLLGRTKPGTVGRQSLIERRH